MVRCPNCGAEVEEGVESCWNCGARFVQEDIDTQPRQQQQYQPPMQRRPKKPFYKKAPFILLIVALIIGSVIGTTYFLFFSEETYHRDAYHYILTEDELDNGWSLSETSQPFEDEDPIESSRKNSFYRNGETLNIQVIVFESIEDAEGFYEHNRERMEKESSTFDEDLGSESYSFVYYDEPTIDVRLSNVFIRVYSNVVYYPVTEVAEQQIEKIEG